MKVYVAGKFADKAKLRKYMDELEKLGHSITYDWTSYKGKPTEDDLFGGSEQDENMEESAVFDIQGVIDCDVLVCIFEDPKYEYRGTFTELGCALGLGKKIITMCPEPTASCRENCFFHHPSIIKVNYWSDVIDTFGMINTFL